VRYCYVHHNAGPGIVVGGDAAPRLLSNLIAGNGTRPGAPAAGIEVRSVAAPLLAGNRIEGNGGAGVVLPGPERIEEVFRWNSFGAATREQAVRVAAGAGQAPAGAAPPRTGSALAGRIVAARPSPPARGGAAPPSGTAAAAASRARRQP
jgi:hypothetical protein